jgi:hypothetical protein
VHELFHNLMDQTTVLKATTKDVQMPSTNVSLLQELEETESLLFKMEDGVQLLKT